jgi:hypothetical protein
MPEFVELLVHHRPKALRGASLIEALPVEERQPARLAAYHQSWRTGPRAMYRASPNLVFAVIGQAKMEGKMSPEEESTIVAKLLTHWALRSTLDTSALCAAIPTMRVAAPVT